MREPIQQIIIIKNSSLDEESFLEADLELL